MTKKKRKSFSEWLEKLRKDNLKEIRKYNKKRMKKLITLLIVSTICLTLACKKKSTQPQQSPQTVPCNTSSVLSGSYVTVNTVIKDTIIIKLLTQNCNTNTYSVDKLSIAVANYNGNTFPNKTYTITSNETNKSGTSSEYGIGFIGTGGGLNFSCTQPNSVNLGFLKL